jgi:hypothetical protein
VTAYLIGQGWTVDHRTIRDADGYTDPDTRQVIIETSLSPADDAATLLHEAAHVILHADESATEFQCHRGVKETEAESVAYVVADLLGLDTSPTSISYVASWSASDTDMIKDTAARVLNAVRILTGALIRDEAEHTA